MSEVSQVANIKIFDSPQEALGIDAPAETTVHREEIYQRIKREKTADAC